MWARNISADFIGDVDSDFTTSPHDFDKQHRLSIELDSLVTLLETIVDRGYVTQANLRTVV